MPSSGQNSFERFVRSTVRVPSRILHVVSPGGTIASASSSANASAVLCLVDLLRGLLAVLLRALVPALFAAVIDARFFPPLLGLSLALGASSSICRQSLLGPGS